MIHLRVNGREHSIGVDPGTPLLWVLRDDLGLTGAKYGCGIALCGACTVHVAGQARRACVVPVGSIGEAEVITIEGLSADGSHPVQQAWAAVDVPQCGYCQPGLIMTVTALLQQNPRPTDADIDQAVTNICRCGTYNRVRRAVRAAAQA